MGSAVLLHRLTITATSPATPSCLAAVLYVPSTAGAGRSSYTPALPAVPLADLAALEAEIAAAMSAGTFVTVDLTGPANTGVVVLNGAACPSWCSARPVPRADAPGSRSAAAVGAQQLKRVHGDGAPPLPLGRR